MLGTVGDDHLYALLDGLAAGDIQAMLDVAATMEARTLSFDAALQELATLLHRIALVQFAPQALLDDTERARLAPYAELLDPEFLQLCYQIAVHGRDELPLAPDEAAGFGMTLLRFHAFRPGGEKVGAGRMANVTVARSAPQVSPPARAGLGVGGPDVAVPPAPTFTPPSAVADPDDWHGLVARLPLGGMVRQLAQHCELASRDGQRIVLRLAPSHKHLQAQQDKLRAELAAHFGHPVTLEIRLDEPAGQTPKSLADNEKRERQERAIAAIESDPFVREACDLFDASIDESTIKPV